MSMQYQYDKCMYSTKCDSQCTAQSTVTFIDLCLVALVGSDSFTAAIFPFRPKREKKIRFLQKMLEHFHFAEAVMLIQTLHNG